mmetsp:Transcript_28070/g.38967  ORF Transcript_28070/g.38967 Transcript_28070/m.38967 type:complete len:759 (+) Transcript_28070:132-2408(+)
MKQEGLRIREILKAIGISPEDRSRRTLKTNDYYKKGDPKWSSHELKLLKKAGFDVRGSTGNLGKKVLYLRTSRIPLAMRVLRSLECPQLAPNVTDGDVNTLTALSSSSSMQPEAKTCRVEQDAPTSRVEQDAPHNRSKKAYRKRLRINSAIPKKSNKREKYQGERIRIDFQNDESASYTSPKVISNGATKLESMPPSEGVFHGLSIQVIPGGMDLSKKRVSILERLVLRHGGKLVNTPSESTILIMSKYVKDEVLPHGPRTKRIVSPEWISSCLTGTIKPMDHRFDRVSSQIKKDSAIIMNTKKEFELSGTSSKFFTTCMKRPENYLSFEEFQSEVKSGSWIEKTKKSLACQGEKLGHFGSFNLGLNDHITRVLKDLMSIYEALAHAPMYNNAGGRKSKGNEYYWKVFSMKKVIGYVENHTKPLRTLYDLEEFKKEFHSGNGRSRNGRKGIGKKTWDKIWEIMQYGKLQRIQSLKNDQKIRTILDFSKIWGVGAATAGNLWKQGFRSIEDLRARKLEANLTKSQLIGLKHYEELQERIPRIEVEEIESVVRKHAECLLPEVTLVTCGSYRRGAPSSGDVDILMSHSTKRGYLLGDFLPMLVSRLRACGFITDELSTSFHHHTRRKHENKTCFGICKLSKGNGTNERLHRRIDLKVYPREHFAFAILYFTGSDHFNRSMRWYAHRKGLSLSDHGLSKAIRVNREKVWEGRSVFCETEEDIFKVLDLDYVEPWRRNIQGSSYVAQRPEFKFEGTRVPRTP